MWWMLLTVGCGNADRDAREAAACEALTPAACSAEVTCAVITAYPTQETDDGTCADYSSASEDIGCMWSGYGCAAVMSFGYDPADPDTVYSFGGCVPTGWEAWSDDWEECN